MRAIGERAEVGFNPEVVHVAMICFLERKQDIAVESARGYLE